MAEADTNKANDKAPATEAAKTAPATQDSKAAVKAQDAPKTDAKPAAAQAEAATAAKSPAAKSKAATRGTKTEKKARSGRPATRKQNVKAAPARPAAQQIKEGKTMINKQTKEAVNGGKAAADQFNALYGDVNERAKTAIERNSKLLEEVAELTRGNVEALVTSSKIAAQGAEALSREAADYGRRSFEDVSVTLRSFAEVKSPTELFRLQGEFARASFDSMVAESSKMSEQMLKLAGEVAQPLTSRYAVAAQRAKTLAA